MIILMLTINWLLMSDTEPTKIRTFQDTWVMIVGILLIAIGAPFIFDEYRNGVISFNALFGFLGSLSTTILMWFGVRAIVIYLGENFPWQKNPLRHLIIEIIAISTYTALVGLLFFAINYFHPMESFAKNLKLSIFFTLMITFFNTAVYEAWYFFMQWKQTLIKSEKLEKETIRSQYETLKSQINPHFLFNNLNTLTTVIEEDPKRAVEYVQQTADYYRTILNLKDKELIHLSDEIELIKNFYNLQRNRYGSNLTIQIDIDDLLLETLIAPLTLQMLVENAIKHNIISRDKPLNISITADNEYLIVKNNFQKRDQEITSNGFGLRNICERYSFFTKKRVVVSQNDSNFIVSIPLLRM